MKKLLTVFLALALIFSSTSLAQAKEKEQTDYSYLKVATKTQITLLSNGNLRTSLKKKSGYYGYVVIEKGKDGYQAYKIPLGKVVDLPLAFGKGTYSVFIGYSKSKKMDNRINVAKEKKVKVTKLPTSRYLSKNFIMLGTMSPDIKQLLKTEFKDYKKWTDKQKVIKVTRYFEKWGYSDELSTYVDTHWYTPNYSYRIKVKDGICYDVAAITGSLLRAMGVKTKFVGGYWKQDKRTYHAWNEAYVNGKWHAVDNTFNMKIWFIDDWMYPDEEPVFDKKSNYIKCEEY